MEIGADPIDMGVGVSNFDASFQMVKGLVDAGYRKIGFVSAPIAANDRATRRREGYLAAMNSAGLEITPGWVREAKFAFSEGARTMGEFIEQNAELEVIFFASDILSIGGVMECRRRGIAVPEEIGVCGFDDLELTAMTDPPLTTVRIPRYEIGRKAAAMILARQAGENDVERIADLEFEVVWRNSTRLPSES